MKLLGMFFLGCVMTMIFTVAVLEGKKYVLDHGHMPVPHSHETTVAVEHNHIEFGTCENVSLAIDEMEDRLLMLDEIDTLQAQAIMELYSLLPADVLEDFLDPDYVPAPKDHRIKL